MILSISAWVINSVMVAVVLSGQYLVYRWARRGLACFLGSAATRILSVLLASAMAAALVRVWLDNFGVHWIWEPAGNVSRALSLGAGIWAAGSSVAALLLAAIARLRRRNKRSGPLPGAAEAPASAAGESVSAAKGYPKASRRDILSWVMRATVAVAPFGVAAYGTLLVRKDFELREVDFPAPGLHPDLDGLRLALLSDIHFGPYLNLPELDRVISMANETKPHIALVTGDLITRAADPLETCLSRLKGLRSEAGIFGCLGNHEIYAKAQNFAEHEGRRMGIDFLRQRSRILDFGNARLNLVGVDYQRQNKPYLVGAAGRVVPGAVNLLLSHNPDVFPVAAKMGYDLVVGGHTHGGQVTVEIVEQTLNINRFFTPFVAGLYRRGGHSLYVSRGIGTIGLPMRLGARPEVVLLRLCRA